MAPLEPIITSPAPTPPPNDLANNVFDHSEPPPLQVGDWGWDDEPDSDGSDSESEDLGVADPSPRVTLPMAKRVAPKSKLSHYWTIATKDEKEKQTQQDFQRIRDASESKRLDEELAEQRKKLRNRAEVRERVQRSRERARMKKIESGWVPQVGHKRVSSRKPRPEFITHVTHWCVIFIEA